MPGSGVPSGFTGNFQTSKMLRADYNRKSINRGDNFIEFEVIAETDKSINL